MFMFTLPERAQSVIAAAWKRKEIIIVHITYVLCCLSFTSLSKQIPFLYVMLRLKASK